MGLSQSRTSGTNKQIYTLINLHKEKEREREMMQDWGPEDGLVPPHKESSLLLRGNNSIQASEP